MNDVKIDLPWQPGPATEVYDPNTDFDEDEMLMRWCK
jgi:hypothetical protein